MQRKKVWKAGDSLSTIRITVEVEGDGSDYNSDGIQERFERIAEASFNIIRDRGFRPWEIHNGNK